MQKKNKRAPPLENPQLYLPHIPRTYKVQFEANTAKYRPKYINKTLEIHNNQYHKNQCPENCRYFSTNSFHNINFSKNHKFFLKTSSKTLELQHNKSIDAKNRDKIKDNKQISKMKLLKDSKNSKFCLEPPNIKNRQQNRIKMSTTKINFSSSKAFQLNKSISPKRYDQNIATNKRNNKLKAVSLSRKTNNYLFESAKKHFQQKQYHKAIQLLHTFQSHFKTSSNYKLEVNYLLGLSYINIKCEKEGIKFLKKVIQENPKYDKAIYLALCQGFHNLGNIQQAIQYASIGISLFRNYGILWTYRGKLHLRVGEHQLGLDDLETAIELCPDLGQPYYQKAATLKAMKKFTNAIKACSQGLHTNLKYMILQLRAKCLFAIGQYKKASSDFGLCLKNAENETSFAYLKGLCHYNANQLSLAFQCFQRAIKIGLRVSKIHNKNEQNTKHQQVRKLMIYSFQLILSMQIQQKNINQAAMNIRNASAYFSKEQEHKTSLVEWKLLIQGMYYLRNKDYELSINMFNQLLSMSPYSQVNSEQEFKKISPKKKQQRFKLIVPLSYLYRAYAYFVSKQFNQAAQDYQKYSQCCKLIQQSDYDLSCRYNVLMIEAYNSFPNCQKYITQMKKLIPQKPEPYVYQSFIKIHKQFIPVLNSNKKRYRPSQSLHSQLKASKQKKSYQLKFDDSISNKMKNTLQQISQILLKAIEMLPTPYQHITMSPYLSLDLYSSCFYYYYSIIMLSLFKNYQALNYINLAIQRSGSKIIEQKINGRSNEVLDAKFSAEDLLKFGHYFYIRGLIHAFNRDYELAISDYNTAIKLQVYKGPKGIKTVFLQNSKCYKLLNNFNQALQLMHQYIKIAPEDSKNYQYLGILLFQNYQYEQSANIISISQDAKQNQNIILTKAKCYLMCNDFILAHQMFTKYQQSTKLSNYDYDIALLQIIISIDTDQSHLNYKQNAQKLLRIQKQIQKAKIEGKQSLKIFKFGQIYELRGCLYIIAEQFQQGIEMLDKSLSSFRTTKKRQLKRFENQMKKQSFSQQIIDGKQYLKKQCWQGWNLREIQVLYNLSIGYLSLQQTHKAIKILQQAQKIDNSLQILGISQVLALAQKINSGKMSVTKKVHLQGLSSQSIISRNWPIVKITGYQIGLSLAFTHPYVQPPHFLPEIHQQIFLNFKMSQIPLNPHSPWTRHNSKGFIFEENIIDISIEQQKNSNFENDQDKK